MTTKVTRQGIDLNRASAQSEDLGALELKIDGVVKSRLGVQNDGSPVLYGEGVNLRANATADLIEYQLGAGVWKPLVSLAVNVTDYGALGNGVADDTAAFVAAAAAAAAAGVGVVIPGYGRTYIINHFTPSNSVKQWIGLGRPVIKAKTAATGTDPLLFSFVTCADVLVTGIVFDGNLSAVGINNNVVQTFNCDRILFDKCWWQNCRGIGLLVSGGSFVGVSNSYFTNCGMYFQTSGLFADQIQAAAWLNHDHAFADFNTFEEVGLDCISFAGGMTNCRASFNVGLTSYQATIYCNDVSGLIIQGNDIQNGADGGSGVDSINCVDVSVIGNVLSGCGTSGLLIADGKRYTVEGNIIKNNGQNSSLPGHGGVVFYSSTALATTHVTLSGNQIYDDQGAGATQLFAIGDLAAGGTFSDISIDESNLITGYSAGGAINPSAIFETRALGLPGYQFAISLADMTETVLYTADRYGIDFRIIDTNGTVAGFTSFVSSSPSKLFDPAGYYATTDTGTGNAVYYSGSTVRLKNRTGSTQTYFIR